jgi:LEA14-like dessication related protein
MTSIHPFQCKSISCFLVIAISFLAAACIPKKDIELKQIKSVVGDISDEPMLKAQVVFFNPNKQKGTLKRINADVFVKDKKVAVVDQQVKVKVPSQGEFTLPLEVKLNLKESGVINTLLSLVGARKIKVRYKGHVKVIYHGLPVTIPIDHEEEVSVRL